ncbi:MAG TPA: diguanylate cyclase [Xanthomonadaceae bacterium]|nr:diguanylate cyclase [Xanthomonadaceae bacterium]
MTAQRGFLAGVALTLALWLATTGQVGAVRGTPLLQRYTAEDYPVAPVHLALAPAPDGAIYVGNIEGLLRFDGAQWQLIELPQRSPARSLALGADGLLYVGGYDQFGVVENSKFGEPVYRDLRGRFGLAGEAANVADVWAVVATRAGVYFRTDADVFLYGYDGATQSWPIPPETRSFQAVGEAVYVRLHGSGLTRFENGELLPVPGGARFAEQPLYAAFARPEGILLLGREGFFLADASGIGPVGGDAAAVFAREEPYSAVELADGSIAVGTFSGTVLRFDSSFSLTERHPLGPYAVLDLARDREGGLWAATEGDLVRLQVPSPWTAYTAEDGLAGSQSDVVWHAGTLWTANTLGVSRAEPSGPGRVRFRQVLETELESYDLEPDVGGLLVAEREGVLWLPDALGPPTRIALMGTTYALLRSRFDPSTVFAFGESAIARLQRRDGRWAEVARWPLDGVSIYGFAQTAADTLWLGNSRGLPERWVFSADDGTQLLERRSFGAAEGLELDPKFGSNVARLGEQLLVISGERAFAFDGQRFGATLQPLMGSLSRPSELSFVESAHGDYAYTSRELLHRPDADAPWAPVHLATRHARGFVVVVANSDERVRVITWNAILQYDPGIEPEVLPPLEVTLRSLEIRESDRAMQRQSPIQLEGRTLPAGTGLRLEFALITMEAAAEVRWRIAGMVEDWSEWNSVADSSITVRALERGNYRLEVEGRTPSRREVRPLQQSFSVSPYWYQTPWAWAAAGLLLLAAIGAVAQLLASRRYRKLEHARSRLELKVEERTRELAEANRKLAELATEDSLTGVANRRALEHALDREWQRCGELAQPLAVIMADVDHFKRFNDEYGHLAGDRRLHWVAQRLAEQVRPVRELLARFGGEEFAVVLPGLDHEAAAERAEKLRLSFAGGDSPLTLSLGVAATVPTADGDPRELLHRADQALYRAKQKGRNRVEIG